MRTLTLVLAAFATVALSMSAYAQDSRFGVGVIVGEPTGLSVKIWLGRKTAIDGAVAWSFLPEDILHVHTNVLFHNFSFLTPRAGRMPIVLGVGGTLRAGETVIAGMRVPVGLAYSFDAVPIDLFAELAPRLDLVPDVGLGLNGAIGIRYTFAYR